MSGQICVTTRDGFSRHAEEMLRPNDAWRTQVVCPRLGASLREIADREVIVARVDGVVAGRAILEAIYYPFAEVVNMEVAPHFRRQRVGSSLVEDMIRRASEFGFLALFLQTDLDNTGAQTLFSRNGFLPAQTGDMLRMIRLINYPAVFKFLRDHPLTQFQSRSDQENWEFSWCDHVTKDELRIGLSGGSCQGDSDGFGPGIRSFSLAEHDTTFDVEMACAKSAVTGEDIGTSVRISNKGEKEINGKCRLLLNAGCAPAAGNNGVECFTVAPKASVAFGLSTVITESFYAEPLTKSCSYCSVPIALEVSVGETVFWLCAQVKLVCSTS
jgi:N-acetylglutamate synthase-like GNAT family acetyltransferase